MHIRIKILCLGFLLIFLSPLVAQKVKPIEYKIIGVDLYCYVNYDLPKFSIDSVLATCEIDPDSLDYYHKTGMLSAGKWQVYDIKENLLILRKPLKVLKGKPQDQKHLLKILSDNQSKANSLNYHFGYNDFSKKAVTELPNGKTRFFLQVEGAKPYSIVLSGTFNDWSTSALSMTPCDSGYYADVSLEEGGHFYKYIINGRWFLDPRNNQVKSDWEGNENSVYFKENFKFELKGNQKADEVYLAGSFNNWEEDQAPFIRTPSAWERPCFLRQGTHAYKFIVDDEWVLDPANPVVRPDGLGNENSFVSVGDTFYFYYPGALDKDHLWVSGEFNAWNNLELEMTKTDSGWVLPYVLAPGNYEYKFIVEQMMEWQLDPLNPITTGNEVQNSILVVGANQHFFYPKVPGVEEVYLSGDFNGWSTSGYRMEPKEDGWHIDLSLKPGKYRYKFIVKDTWLRDPSNPLFEPNEYGDFNSVLWVK